MSRVAEHDIEHDHRGGRVGCLGGEPIEPEAMVDHGVRAPGRQLVIAKVDHDVPGAGTVGPAGLARASQPARVQPPLRP
jgi:hypothetical protein